MCILHVLIVHVVPSLHLRVKGGGNVRMAGGKSYQLFLQGVSFRDRRELDVGGGPSSGNFKLPEAGRTR